MVHNIDTKNFYSLLQLIPFDLGYYIRDIINYRSSALAQARDRPLGSFPCIVFFDLLGPPV